MIVSISYNLPDELDIYQEALQAKTITRRVTADLKVKEMHDAIKLYMLQPTHDNLLALTQTLEKYGSD